MADLYDRADIYALFDNEKRFQAYKKHWESVLSGRDIRPVLDVTLPLVELGVELCGSDLSGRLKRCADTKLAICGIEIFRCGTGGTGA